ncbi:M56 family metallopeptidase [Pedobacter sp. PWIIR3]
MEFQTAIYRTLLHSLWMGLTLALLTSVIIVATKKSTATLRYNLLTMALTLFMISIAIVFCYELSNKTVETSGINQHTAIAEVNRNLSPAATKGNTDSGYLITLKAMIGFWGHYSNQIVLIWFLIICAKCVQLMAGLHTIYYLKKTSVIRAGSYWENKVAELAFKLEITKHIQILHSGLAKVPMIVGHFKPVILVPLGMLNGLTLQEVEAILSHELAHLKRNDYLVNLLQSLVEIVFFFNPGVLWLSKLIKEERENCCDDLALSCTESKHQYIKALISCQEFKANQPVHAMAITGRKNSLKERVGRLVFNSNSSLNRVEKVILAIVLVSSLVLTAAFSSIKSSETRADLTLKPASVKLGAYKNVNTQDTTKKPVVKKAITTKSTLKKERTTRNDPKTTQKVIDGKISDAVKAEIDAARYSAKAKAYDDEAKKYDDEARRIDTKKYQADVKKYQADIAKYQAKVKNYAANVDKYAAEAARHAADPDKYPEPALPVVPSVPSVPARPTSASVPPTAPTPPAPPVNVTTTGNVNLSNLKVDIAPLKQDMTTDLRNEGLLKDTKNFKYQLNSEALIINGIKQTDEIHQKYLKKYLKNKKGTITTTVSSN